MKKRFFTRFTATVVSIAIIATTLLSITLLANADVVSPIAFDENNITLRFGVMTDTHIGHKYTTANTPRFEKALEFFKTRAGGEDNLDLLTISGDLTHEFAVEETKTFATLLEKHIDANKTKLVASNGNHEVYGYSDNFKTFNTFRDELSDYMYTNPVAECSNDDITHGNYHGIYNGYHFITVYGIDGNHAASDVAWLDNQLKIATKADPDKPVFVLTHVTPTDTVYGSVDSARWSSSTISAALNKYPQAVVFTGHTHNTAVPETTLWQGNYTVIHAGVISDNLPTVGYMEVDKNGTMRYARYFLNSGETEPTQIKDSWVFPVMKDKTDALYTLSARAAAKSIPYFENDRKDLQITKNFDFNTVKLTAKIPTAKDEDMVFQYLVEVRNKQTKEVINSNYIQTSFEQYSNPSTQMPVGYEYVSLTAPGLEKSTDYEICAYAVDIFGNRSIPLIEEFKTANFSDNPLDDFNFKPIQDFNAIDSSINFGYSTQNDNSIIEYTTNFKDKLKINALTDNALEGKALNISSIKGSLVAQSFTIKPQGTVDAQTPSFLSIYIDASAYTEREKGLKISFTTTDYTNSGSVNGEATYSLAPKGLYFLMDSDGYINKSALEDGKIKFPNGFKGRIVIPLWSFELTDGNDANSKVDCINIKDFKFEYTASGVRNSLIVLDEIGFGVSKDELNSIPFAKLNPDYILGDSDGNGVVNTLDALTILKHIAKIEEIDNANLLAADVDKNGTINTLDSLQILKFTANLIPEL